MSSDTLPACSCTTESFHVIPCLCSSLASLLMQQWTQWMVKMCESWSCSESEVWSQGSGSLGKVQVCECGPQSLMIGSRSALFQHVAVQSSSHTHPFKPLWMGHAAYVHISVLLSDVMILTIIVYRFHFYPWLMIYLSGFSIWPVMRSQIFLFDIVNFMIHTCICYHLSAHSGRIQHFAFMTSLFYTLVFQVCVTTR